MQIKGTYTAMITPFIDESLDEEGLRKNIRYQIQSKVNGIVLLGTTGEATTLSDDEKVRIIEIGREECKHKTQLIVGTGSSSTQKAVVLTDQAKNLGADAALVATPAYNKPNQEGIFRHFEAISSCCKFPIIAYNTPRTGVLITVPTLLRIANLEEVIAIKEASGNVHLFDEMIRTLWKTHPDFSFLSGDDSLNLPLIALGASGTVSVLSNLVPKLIRQLVNHAREDVSKALKIHFQLTPLYDILALDVNPIAIKEAMNQSSLPAGGVRLPLTEMDQEKKKKLTDLLKKLDA